MGSHRNLLRLTDQLIYYKLFFTSYSLLTIFAFIARVIVTFCLPEENNLSNCNIFIIKDYIVPLLLYC